MEFVENTLPAFRNAALHLKVDLLELDCQLTKDGKPVIFHDKTLKRMCGIPWRISDYNYADLPLLLMPAFLESNDIVTKDINSYKIPLFEDLLKEFPKYPMQGI